jgi:FdhE protein
MHRAHAAQHGQAELTLDAAEASNPEWAPWLRLLRRARDPERAPWQPDVGLGSHRAADTPLLHEAVIALDAVQARGWIAELVGAAASESDDPTAYGDLDFTAGDAMSLLEATIALDGERFDGMASARGADPARLAAVLQLGAAPVLLACRHRVAGELPRSWTRGFCGFCSAWPAFAEMRGLERQRSARCGRCAFEWRFDVLHCPYCGEREHAQHASLIIEGDETRRIDTCRTCNGYLKSVATLMAVPDDRVAVRDVETVELDLVAAERGLIRPPERPFPLEVRLAAKGAHKLAEDGRRWFFA